MHLSHLHGKPMFILLILFAHMFCAAYINMLAHRDHYSVICLSVQCWPLLIRQLTVSLEHRLCRFPNTVGPKYMHRMKYMLLEPYCISNCHVTTVQNRYSKMIKQLFASLCIAVPYILSLNRLTGALYAVTSLVHWVFFPV